MTPRPGMTAAEAIAVLEKLRKETEDAYRLDVGFFGSRPELVESYDKRLTAIALAVTALVREKP